MPPARLVGRAVASAVVLLVVASLVLAVVALGAVRRTMPRTDGSVTVRGISGNVDILRNAQGVPDIYADTPEDLFFAQGYASAQDRFFQMDLRRHVTAGRLSELVGPAGLPTDKLVRTLGWRQVAEAELPRLSAPTRRYLNAYADGVNAYLAEESSPGSIALEYLLLGTQHPGYTIERWDAVDSLAWLKAMAWDLHGNYDSELDRALMLADGVPMTTVKALYPAYPTGRLKPILGAGDWTSPGAVTPTTPKAMIAGTSVLPAGGYAPTARTASAASASTPATTLASSAQVLDGTRAAFAGLVHLVGQGEGIGSNSWVVSGKRTSTGKPLLANDPHLGLDMPGIWHQVGLHCRRVDASCPFDVSGFSFAGLPGVVIGRTPQVAWGFTNLDPDVSDFYLERIKDGRAERAGTTEPLRTRDETIKVAGGEDVHLTVRSTRHGPIVSDVSENVAAAAGRSPDGSTPAVSLAWTGLVPGRSADALFALDRARSGADVRAALELFSAPGQNCVWADSTGSIGYQAPGLVPVRASATPGEPAGWLPAPGWDPAYDWRGYVPYASMPHTENPSAGFIVAANQQATASTPPFLTDDWTMGWRSERIRELLAADPRVTPDDMRRIQSDTTPAAPLRLAKALLAVKVDDPFVRQGQDTLRGWSGAHPVGESADSRAATFLGAVWAELVRTMLQSRVGRHVQVDGGSHWAYVVDSILGDPRNPLWDDPGTPAIETRDAALLAAMTRARDTLTRTQGKDPARWDWGRSHTLTLQHPLSSGIPGVLVDAFDRGPLPVPGSALSVDAYGGDLSSGSDAVTHGPSMRLVVDLANPDSSTWVDSTGVSGHPFDAHYGDQIEAWTTNRPYPWLVTQGKVEQAAQTRLRLEPDPSGN